MHTSFGANHIRLFGVVPLTALYAAFKQSLGVLLIVIASGQALASESHQETLESQSLENGILVFDAKIKGKSTQPKWMALWNEQGELLHYRLGPVVARVPPGTYWLDHLDFHDDPMKANLKVRRLRPHPKIRVEAGSVRVLGRIVLPRLKYTQDARSNRIRLDEVEELYEFACNTNPGIMKGKKVIFGGASTAAVVGCGVEELLEPGDVELSGN